MKKLISILIDKIIPIIKKLSPVLENKIPLFAQTFSQFGTSKTNYMSVGMIMAGLYLLYNDPSSSIGTQLITTGAGFITVRDTVVRMKNGKQDDQ